MPHKNILFINVTYFDIDFFVKIKPCGGHFCRVMHHFIPRVPPPYYAEKRNIYFRNI